jgi:hypothetical protein
LVTGERASFLADPECSAHVLKQTGDPPVREPGGIRRIEHLKPFSVESSQAAEGSKPEIAVAGLHRRSHEILRQSVLGLPDSDRIAVGQKRGG